MAEKNLYLIVMLLSLSVPLLRSFEPRVAFYKSFKALFPAILWIGFPFIIWDIFFTGRGIWGFNSRYLSGVEFYGLPLGEYLFFVVIPFCSVFIYRVLNYFIKKDPLRNKHIQISRFLIGFSVAMAVIFFDRAYTFFTFSFLALLIFYHAEFLKSGWMGRFYLAFAVILIPFFIVNGILTGMWIEEEIVWYNNMENINLRLYTIPLEDVFYGMLLLLGVVGVYEKLGRRMKLPFAQDNTTE